VLRPRSGRQETQTRSPWQAGKKKRPPRPVGGTERAEAEGRLPGALVVKLHASSEPQFPRLLKNSHKTGTGDGL